MRLNSTISLLVFGHQWSDAFRESTWRHGSLRYVSLSSCGAELCACGIVGLIIVCVLLRSNLCLTRLLYMTDVSTLGSLPATQLTAWNWHQRLSVGLYDNDRSWQNCFPSSTYRRLLFVCLHRPSCHGVHAVRVHCNWHAATLRSRTPTRQSYVNGFAEIIEEVGTILTMSTAASAKINLITDAKSALEKARIMASRDRHKLTLCLSA